MMYLNLSYLCKYLIASKPEVNEESACNYKPTLKKCENSNIHELVKRTEEQLNLESSYNDHSLSDKDISTEESSSDLGLQFKFDDKIGNKNQSESDIENQVKSDNENQTESDNENQVEFKVDNVKKDVIYERKSSTETGSNFSNYSSLSDSPKKVLKPTFTPSTEDQLCLSYPKKSLPTEPVNVKEKIKQFEFLTNNNN
ncbi:hypothetical protein HERIO_1819 [Hepatospora eriocheir]|uniref:Uncharacterized protein n=1 Tax=Hepatospora eriocheir TaxID=1081669 RepID=A0A1X0Q978_9MICR|nr:hypothetical protein HERIO_1819 [Hepatospora eriocheir]